MVIYTTDIEELNGNYDITKIGNHSFTFKNSLDFKTIREGIRNSLDEIGANCLDMEERVELGEHSFILKCSSYLLKEKDESINR